MKLAVSNIAWDRAEEDGVLQVLRSNGVNGIEVAPTKIWPHWSGATVEAAEALGRHFGDLGFTIPAIQSVLFDRPELRLFSDEASRRALRDHLAMVGRLARALGAQTIVFGSPTNRDRGALESEEAMERAARFFSLVSADFYKLGVCLCIEANPPTYGCNFITHWSEAAELVRRVGSAGFGLHFDVACTVLAGDDPAVAIRDCGMTIKHFHVSEPQLGGFVEPTIDHAVVGKALYGSGYEGWVSIEMRRQEDPLSSVRAAVRHAKLCYFRE